MSELKLRPMAADEAIDILQNSNAMLKSRIDETLAFAHDPAISIPYDDIDYCKREYEAVELAIDALRRAQPANSRFSDCHIWEPGDRLDTISDKCEVLIKAADIRELMGLPVNEPLTLDELRKYYITCHDCADAEYSRTITCGYVCRSKSSPCRGRVTVGYDFCAYGHRKPERETQ